MSHKAESANTINIGKMEYAGSKIEDEYLESFPRREAISRQLDLEVL